MEDEDAIVATVRDYWEGWFGGDAERMRQALHPDLRKVGVTTGDQRIASMTAADMIGWARDGDGVAERPADFGYDVIIGDRYRQIATVTVSSAIYREYLHLVKTVDGWKIYGALYMRMSA